MGTHQQSARWGLNPATGGDSNSMPFDHSVWVGLVLCAILIFGLLMCYFKKHPGQWSKFRPCKKSNASPETPGDAAQNADTSEPPETPAGDTPIRNWTPIRRRLLQDLLDQPSPISQDLT